MEPLGYLTVRGRGYCFAVEFRTIPPFCRSARPPLFRGAAAAIEGDGSRGSSPQWHALSIEVSAPQTLPAAIAPYAASGTKEQGASSTSGIAYSCVANLARRQHGTIPLSAPGPAAAKPSWLPPRGGTTRYAEHEGPRWRPGAMYRMPRPGKPDHLIACCALRPEVRHGHLRTAVGARAACPGGGFAGDRFGANVFGRWLGPWQRAVCASPAAWVSCRDAGSRESCRASPSVVAPEALLVARGS